MSKTFHHASDHRTVGAGQSTLSPSPWLPRQHTTEDAALPAVMPRFHAVGIEARSAVQPNMSLVRQIQMAARTSAPPLINRQEHEHGEDAARSTADHAARTALHEAALRDLYHRGHEAIVAEAEAMLQAGKSPQEVAQWTVRARNELRSTIRRQGEPIVDAVAKATRGARDMPSYESLRARGKTDGQIIESAARSNVRADRWVGRLRIAGRILIAVDIGVATYNIAAAPTVDRPRVMAQEVGRLAGALTGGWAGAKGGAAVGGAIGSIFPGAGTAVGAGIGSIVGGIGGAIVGGWAGETAAEWAIGEFYPPEETRFEQSR